MAASIIVSAPAGDWDSLWNVGYELHFKIWMLLFLFHVVFTPYCAPADQMAWKGACPNVITCRNCFYLTVWFLWQVVLETEITNRPALRLYENLGFVRDKRLFRYYLNGVDALRLKLWLRWRYRNFPIK